MALASLAGAPGAAAELTRDVPGPERGVCALAGCAEPGMGAVGFFLRCWLILPRYGILACADPWYPLAGQGDQARGFQLVQHAPDPIGLLSCTAPGSAPDTHTMSPAGLAMTCMFIPCLRCLPE